jgi:hypothetical protein
MNMFNPDQMTASPQPNTNDSQVNGRPDQRADRRRRAHKCGVPGTQQYAVDSENDSRKR